MNKLKLLGGGAVIVSTVAVATAGAFAATPTLHQGLLFGSNSNLPAIKAHAGMVKNGGNGPMVKLQVSLAHVLGLTPDQLKAELQTKTLDQIAADHGMTRQQLLTAALQDAGFSDAQIQKIMNAMGKVPQSKAGLLRLQ